MRLLEKSEDKSSVRNKLEIPPPVEIEARIHEDIIGQELAITELAKLYVKIRSGIRVPVGVTDSVFLAGPSGVGKTESVLTLAKMLAETNPEENMTLSSEEIIEVHREEQSRKMAGDFYSFKGVAGRRKKAGLPLMTEREILSKIIKIDGGNFQHGHEVASILGSPPGYLGFGEKVGLLHEKVLPNSEIIFKDFTGQKRKVIFILLDEAEKAHEKLHNAFLTILDKGRLTLGDNSISDLSNAVIFFTSNVGNVESERSREHGMGFIKQPESSQKSFAGAYKGTFRPEYRGRINRTVVFEHLNDQELAQVAKLQLKKVEQQFSQVEVKLDLQISPAALMFLVKAGRNLSEGARAMKKR